MISMFVIYTCVNRAQTHSRVALRLTKLLVIYINMSHITLPPQGGGEQFLKGWVVTSVNEWGGDQERLLLLTDRRM